MAEVKEKVTAFKGKIFNVVGKTIKLDNGEIIKREIVEKNPVVVALIMDRNTDTAYVCEEFRSGAMRTQIGLVAGIIDEGESPLRAMLRELREELGFDDSQVIEVNNLGSGFSSPGFTNELSNFFSVIVDGDPNHQQQLDGDEFINVKRIPCDDLVEMCMKGELGNQASTCIFRHLILVGNFRQNLSPEKEPKALAESQKAEDAVPYVSEAQRLMNERGTDYNWGKMAYNKRIDKWGRIIGYFFGNDKNILRYKVVIVGGGESDWNEASCRVVSVEEYQKEING